MTKYREILRLKSLGFSERNIAQSCGVSRNTVAKVLKKAAEINLSWPLDFDMTDSALEELMFPKDKSATNKRMLTPSLVIIDAMIPTLPSPGARANGRLVNNAIAQLVTMIRRIITVSVVCLS